MITASELSGAKLDYWVAKAVGLTPKIVKRDGDEYCATMEDSEGIGVAVSEDRWRDPHIGYPFSPSSDWADGGAMIDKWRLRVGPHFSRDGDWAGEWRAVAHAWSGEALLHAEEIGSTALEAACRAIVATKFGS